MHKTTKIGGLALLAIVGIISLGLVPTAQSQTVRYWDTDGTNPGLGVGGPYDWILDNLWNTDPTGGGAGTTGGWTDGDTPIFNGNGVSTVTVSSAIDAWDFAVGQSAVDATATTLNLSGSGSLNCVGGYCSVGFQANDITATNDSAVLNLTGLTFYLNQTLYVGRFGCSGTINLSGGASLTGGASTTTMGEGAYPGGGLTTANAAITVSNALFSPNGNLNMAFSPGIAPTPTVATLTIGSGGTAQFGTIEVGYTSNTVASINVNNGGILLANLLIRGLNANGSTVNTIATLNFNGGCFRARRSGEPTIGWDGNAAAPLDAVNIQSGGVIFDTEGFGVYITQGLLDGGGGGGLTKTNTGNLILMGVNTYTGGTTVEQGSIYLEVYSPYQTSNGSIDDSAFINIYPGATVNVNGRSDNTLPVHSGQILEGGGTVTGNTTVNGTLAPGNSWAPGTMSLDVIGTITLAGTTIMDLNRTNAVNSDRLVSNHPIVRGGALIVTNVGPALVAGDTFTLFVPSGGYSGTFSSTNLPALPSSLAWVTTNLTVNGSISVVAAPAAPAFAHIDYAKATQGIIGFNATNGTPGAAYTLMMTTNLALPLNQWSTVSSGNFDGSGDITGLYITNQPPGSQAFFILNQ